MIRLRPYDMNDAETVLSWCSDEVTFYKWSAGALGAYPITKKQFEFVNNLMAFVAVNDDELVGFFTMRRPTESFDLLRFGFIIVDPEKRGKKYGRSMLQLGIRYAKEIFGAKKLSVGVFENNEAAYRCYRSLGFHDSASGKAEKYTILGEEWKYLELEMDLI